MTHTFFRYGTFRILAALSIAAWVGLVAEQAAFGQAKTVSAGVYTAAQADRGQKQYEAACAACHELSQWSGNDFLATWGGKSVHDLFDQVKTTMPQDNPGSLKPQQYADILSYFFKLNKFPAGEAELKGDADALKGILIDKRAAK